MKNDINLLPQKKRNAKDTRQTRILRLTSLGLLLLISVVSVGIFLVTALSPLPKLRAEETQASSELDALRAKSAKYVLTNARLTEVDKMLSTRLKYPEALNDMQDSGVETISFTGIKLKERDVTLTISSNSLSSINDMIEGLKTKSENGKIYRNFSLSSLDYLNDGTGYRVGLNVTLR